MKDVDFWKATAQARTRLAVLAFAVGLIAGFIFAVVISAAPVHFDEAVM